MDTTDQDPAGAPPAPSAPKGTKVRVLVECQHGQPNTVVTLAVDEAKAAEKAGLVDSSKAAVAYAEKLARSAATEED